MITISVCIFIALLIAFGIYIFFFQNSFSLEKWKQKLSTHVQMIPATIWGELYFLDKEDEKFPEKLSEALQSIIKKSTVLTVKAVNDQLIGIEKWYCEQMVIFSENHLKEYPFSKKQSFQSIYKEVAVTCIDIITAENSTGWLSKSETVQPLLISLSSNFEEYRKSLEDYLNGENDLLELIKNGSNALLGVVISTFGFTSGNYIQGLQGVSLGASSILSQYDGRNIREKKLIQAKRKLDETIYSLQIAVEQSVIDRWDSQSQALVYGLSKLDTKLQKDFNAKVLEHKRKALREKFDTLQITSAEKEALIEKLIARESLSPDEKKLVAEVRAK